MYRFGHWALLILSTPHGTLGTLIKKEKLCLVHMKSFNSTRYIRNYKVGEFSLDEGKALSTPHGTLGTVEEA